MTHAGDLSRPERGCARDQARRIRERVHADGGCCFCTKRAHIFETVGRRAVCGLDPPKAFPDCLDARAGFAFDEESYREVHGRKR